MAGNLASFLVFLLVINTVFGLTCYHCDSSENTLCKYGLTSFTYNTMNCDAQTDSGIGNFLGSIIPKQCMKITAKTKDGTEYVGRSCAIHLGNTACTAIVKTIGFFGNIGGDIEDMQCYMCDGDKCNSTIQLNANIGTMFGLLLAALAFLF